MHYSDQFPTILPSGALAAVAIVFVAGVIVAGIIEAWHESRRMKARRAEEEAERNR